ncbi:hypothetical protein ACGF12_24880 [Kitasatospora sp. NPDC048296]|uniref:hypothetical protein n=1 Tax=Kitasatospora sp. NPDC048296 TaxID=3364048 RepID=UPI0037245882
MTDRGTGLAGHLGVRPVECGGECLDGFVGGVLEEVSVEIDGDGEVGVAQGLGDDGQRDAGGDAARAASALG